MLYEARSREKQVLVERLACENEDVFSLLGFPAIERPRAEGAFFFPEQARQGFIPHATSGRMWLLRLGYYKLNVPLEQADDWAFLADHAIEIGKHRFLGIIGIRLSNLPPPGECLQLSDMTPIALLPVESSTQEIVHHQLETVVVETNLFRELVARITSWFLQCVRPARSEK